MFIKHSILSYKLDLIQKIMWFKLTSYLVIIILEICIDGYECVNTIDVDHHLDMGKQYLAEGQLGDALSHYHSAIEGDPTNYLTYFKRGTIYLVLGKAKNAISDFDRVLEIKPDFIPAKINRGQIYLKQGNYDLAQLDFYNVLKLDPNNQEAYELIGRIEPGRERLRDARYHYGNNDIQNAIQLITDAIEISPWAVEFYELRAEMHMENDDVQSAVNDIRSSTKLQTDNTAGYLKLSQLLYKLGQATESLKAIRECLKLDPEHKDCFPIYKKMKKIEKFLTDAETAYDNKLYDDCIDNALKIIKNEHTVQNIIFDGKKLLCKCYRRDEQTDNALNACTDALDIYKESDIFCDRADAYLQSELYDDAIRDYRSAIEIDSHNERAKEGLNRAENRQKQSEKRDYYKILDVKRTASKREITKAYRKAAQKWHPDNYQNDEKMKKIAEKKFIDIAAAKEVLTDDEKRRQFDNGEDPLDPESGRGGMPNFHHFQTFHGSPFQFRFHFN